MAEKFSFFDPVEIAPDVFDREYNAQEFTDYFASLVTTGVMKGAGNQLEIKANGSNMISEIDTGIAFVEGRYYANTNKLAHTHDTEVLGKNRIDRIVVRLDLGTEARYVKSFIKKGVASASPVPPVLQRDNLVYEISLAQVKVIGGQTYINKADVTDERGQDALCPWAGSNILPNFDDDALQELINSQLTDGPKTKFYDGDLNDLTQSGFYYSNGMDINKHFPKTFSSGFKVLIEVMNSDGWIQQKLTLLHMNRWEFYIRKRLPYTENANPGETWYPWQVYPEELQEEPIKVVPAAGFSFPSPTFNSPLSYYKDSFGIVHLYGSLQSDGTNITLTTLPVGYRPKSPFNCIVSTPSGIKTMSINASGVLMVNPGGAGNVTIDTSFRI